MAALCTQRYAGMQLFDYSVGRIGRAGGQRRLVLFFGVSSHSHRATEHVRGAFTVCIAPALPYPDYSRTGCLGGTAGKFRLIHVIDMRERGR